MDALATVTVQPFVPLDADTPTLVCERCRAPVVAASDLLRQTYIEGRGTLWFPHELELLDEDVPTYGGAKDPSGSVDNYVVRVSVSQRSKNALKVIPGERPTAFNTWFPPYLWSIVACASCHGHLGWLFTPPCPSSGNSPSNETSPPTSSFPQAAECTAADMESAPMAPATDSSAADEDAAPPLVPFFGLKVINLRDSRVPPQ